MASLNDLLTGDDFAGVCSSVMVAHVKAGSKKGRVREA